MICESTPTVAAPVQHHFDALGRETSITSPLGFTASQTHNQFGQVASETDFTGQRTDYEYYPNGVLGAGQLKCATRTDGRKTYFGYTARGELAFTWGDVPYPEERVYSDYGELVELHTFRGGLSWTGANWPTSTTGTADVTTWIYQAHSSLLTNKTDAAGRKVTYTYASGLLQSNIWARGVSSRRTYNEFGDIATIQIR